LNQLICCSSPNLLTKRVATDLRYTAIIHNIAVTHAYAWLGLRIYYTFEDPVGHHPAAPKNET